MSQQSVLEYSDSQLVLHSQSFSNSKFIHFKDLQIILLFVLIQFLCDYHLFNLELNLRQGEEVLIIGIKSGGLWLPVSKIVLLKVLLPWLYTVKSLTASLDLRHICLVMLSTVAEIWLFKDIWNYNMHCPFCFGSKVTYIVMPVFIGQKQSCWTSLLRNTTNKIHPPKCWKFKKYPKHSFSLQTFLLGCLINDSKVC